MHGYVVINPFVASDIHEEKTSFIIFTESKLGLKVGKAKASIHSNDFTV